MIPKIIHQTWKDLNVTHWIFKNSQASISRYLPDWEYRFWTDADLDLLVQEYFAGIYEGWKRMDKHIKRVDMARYCMLYKYGGMYADLDFIFTGNVAEIMDQEHDLFFYRSTQSLVKGWKFLGNAFMISAPTQQFWLDFMNYSLSLPAHTPVLEHTGPLALGKFYDSLPTKPNARIFGPEYFDNERAVEGIGPHTHGYHVRTATWQHVKEEAKS